MKKAVASQFENSREYEMAKHIERKQDRMKRDARKQKHNRWADV